MGSHRHWMLEETRRLHSDLLGILDQVDTLNDAAFLKSEYAQRRVFCGARKLRHLIISELARISDDVARSPVGNSQPKDDDTPLTARDQ